MKTNWDRYYEQKMGNPTVRALVEEELASLRLGAKIAKLRQEQGLTQEQLAARCGMKAPNVSRIENDPSYNLTVGTVSRLAAALGYDVGISFRRSSARRHTVKRYAKHKKK